MMTGLIIDGWWHKNSDNLSQRKRHHGHPQGTIVAGTTQGKLHLLKVCGGTVESGCTGIDNDYRNDEKNHMKRDWGDEYYIAHQNWKSKDKKK